MNELMKHVQSRGLKTASLPLLDNPIYYGSLDDFDVTFLINPWGLPELSISTSLSQKEELKSFTDYLSTINLKETYHIHTYDIVESCMHFMWNFHPDKFNHLDIINFMDWFFPLLKKYHATPANICTECGQTMTPANSGWFNISGTGITRHLHKRCRGKMEREIQQASAHILRKYPTIKRGILGALIGAVPATLLYAFSYQFGSIVVASGMLLPFLSWMGYTFNCGFQCKWKPLLLYLISLGGILLGYLMHPLFGTPLSSPEATDPMILLFISHILATFLLICIWIAEVVICTSNKKSGLSGIIKLK